MGKPLLKAIIVDDEIRGIENLEILISKYCTDVEIIGSYSTIDSAYEAIVKDSPNLVFLDVDMPPYTGFDLLKKFESIHFNIIFVTAFDHYAIDAIKFSALYYVLKPIRIDELKMAIEKAKKTISHNPTANAQYFNELTKNPDEIKKLIIKSQKEIEIVNIDDIYFIEADNVYTIFRFSDSKKIVSSKSIKDYEELLTNKGFFRVHRSYIVNLNKIKQIDKIHGDELILTNNQRIPLAVRRKESLLEKLHIDH